MVCSRGESLTTHPTQMKLFTAIATAAVMGTSLLTATPAEARNGWVQAICDDNTGECYYVKVISKRGSYVDYKVNTVYGLFTYTGDCNGYRKRQLSHNGGRSQGQWKDVMPNSWGEAELETACR